MSKEITLVFSHLYDDVWAAFPRSNRNKSPLRLPSIIFPKDFQPETGNKYKCRVVETAAGIFIYDGQNYKISYAVPVEMGSAADYLEYQLDVLERRNSHLRKDGGETMKAAFQKLLEGDKGFEKFVKTKKAGGGC